MYRHLLLLGIFLFAVPAVAGYSFEYEVLDADGNTVSSNITVSNDTSTEESQDSIQTQLDGGSSYTVETELPGINVTLNGFSLSNDTVLNPRTLNLETPSGSDYLADLDEFFYLNETENFTLANATIDTERQQPDRVARCKTVTESFGCSEWEFNGTGDYVSSYQDGVFSYTVEKFSAYSSGVNAPLPEVNGTRIFDSEGDMVANGTNTTLEVRVNNTGKRNFTYVFDVVNNGSESWDVLSSNGDLMVHDGVNNSWSVNTGNISYNISGNVYEGGSFQNGKVEWTNSSGTLSQGGFMKAEYTVEISDDSSNTYDQNFTVEASGNGDTDLHDTFVRILGFLDPTIESPDPAEAPVVLQKDRLFDLNGTVECVGGECGSLSFDPRRNGTGQEVMDGTYFNVDSFSSTGCDDVVEGDVCEVEWKVNATAPEGDEFKLDWNVSSEYSIESNSTGKVDTVVQSILDINLNFSVVDFGLQSPGENAVMAANNTEGHTVKVDEQSNKVEELLLKGENLTHVNDDSYQIPIGNMNESDQNDTGTSENVTSGFTKVFDSTLNAGDEVDFFFWLDVPTGILRGEYRGNITFKASTGG